MLRTVLIVVLAVAAVAVAAPTLFGQVGSLREEMPDLLDRGSKDGQGAAQISTAEFAHIPAAIRPKRLRALAGEPESKSKTTVEGVRIECWYYGIVGSTGSYQFCFANDRLTARFRFAPFAQ